VGVVVSIASSKKYKFSFFVLFIINYILPGLAGTFGSSIVSISEACVTSKIPLRLRRTLTFIFDGVPSGCG